MNQDPDYQAIRQMIIDWLDDNYHFGDAAELITADDLSWLDNGVLDSLGFVQLILYLEPTFGIEINRKYITRENFDGMAKIITYLLAHPGYQAVPA